MDMADAIISSAFVRPVGMEMSARNRVLARINAQATESVSWTAVFAKLDTQQMTVLQ